MTQELNRALDTIARPGFAETAPIEQATEGDLVRIREIVGDEDFLCGPDHPIIRYLAQALASVREQERVRFNAFTADLIAQQTARIEALEREVRERDEAAEECAQLLERIRNRSIPNA